MLVMFDYLKYVDFRLLFLSYYPILSYCSLIHCGSLVYNIHLLAISRSAGVESLFESPAAATI